MSMASPLCIRAPSHAPSARCTLAADTPCDWLPTNVGSARIHDDSGFASGALLYDVDLQPGQSQEIVLDLPQHARQRPMRVHRSKALQRSGAKNSIASS